MPLGALDESGAGFSIHYNFYQKNQLYHSSQRLYFLLLILNFYMLPLKITVYLMLSSLCYWNSVDLESLSELDYHFVSTFETTVYA